ncbi:Enterobactin exporter EntS [Anoxybacillus sp. P3H1B]|uniref:MFS transporter n=1 Tax=Anoxybacillus sp. P3H1B TaxID=1769293 RepID=UPI000793FBD2|nr:MFS transporter [Anoxybacillus sp. P3H1B]KXG08571.1 Enterobactin exporter EntS [Anoxybacillus sp. P3H1B]
MRRKIYQISIFKSLRYKNFFLLWLGLFISNIGTWSQMFVEQWYIYSLNKSPLDVGLLTTMQLIPNTLFMIIGGTLADRINRKRLLLFTQTSMAVLTLIIATFIFLDKMSIGLLLVLNFLYGIFVALDIPARRSLVPKMVPKEFIGNANALYGATFQIALFLGPIVGSFITSMLGFKFTFFFNAFTFIVIILCVWKMNVPKESTTIHIESKFLDDLKNSRSIFISNKAIFMMIILGFLSALISKIDFLLPAYVDTLNSSNTEILGLLNSSIGLGLLVSAIIFGKYDRSFQQKSKQLLLFGFLVISICTTFIPFIKFYLVSVVIIFVRSLFTQFCSLIIISQLQYYTSDEYLGRVMGVYSSLIAFSGLFSLPISYLVDKFSVEFAFILLSIISLFSVFVLLNRKMNQALNQTHNM